jgi:integrase
MASISKDRSGNVRILFMAPDGKRKAVRLGAVPRKVAESIKLRVEALASAAAARVPMDPETAAWVGGIADDLAAKLAAVGLIPARPKAVTLSGLLALYAAEREARNKPGTRTNHRTITNDLAGFFGPDADPRRFTPDHGAQFLDHLRARGLAAPTVARRVRRARSIFAFALKKKLLTANPFAEVKAVSALPADRKAYVSAADAGRLITAANPTWRTIIALARYAGLRCPSEVFSLRWSDVNFEADRMSVPSPKTEGTEGKEYRVCPIFEELRPHLDEAFELAPEGAEYVVSGPTADRVRAASKGPNGWVGCNLRTEFGRLIRRAGLAPWPRLFHTLRASCETDLLERFPISAVTEWLGHSAAVALKHYTRVPDHLFERAAGGGAYSGARAAHFPAQTGADGKGPERAEPAEVLAGEASSPMLSSPVPSRPDILMTLPGFEPGF